MTFKTDDRVVLLRAGRPTGKVVHPDRGHGVTYVHLDSGTRCNYPTVELAAEPDTDEVAETWATLVHDDEAPIEVPF